MKSGVKKGWNSIVPLHLGGKSTTRFGIFQKVKSASYSPGNTPVSLNLYDLTEMNGYVYWAGLGIFHSALEGSFCNCLLPEALKVSAVRHDLNYQASDSEKRRLRSAFSCLSSISTRQRQLSKSMFIHSPFKRCLPPLELRRSNIGSLKER